MDDGVGTCMKPGNRDILRTAPMTAEEREKADDTEINTIAAGALSGGVLGSFLPVIGTAVGATLGAGIGFIAALTSREIKESARPQYQALDSKEEED
uniref:Glycine zipper domain-containing protein n=1 Tax=Panagrolaimus sp. JU765 TaxID=591449 RepID=A0AC34QJJ1_9BILA